MEGGGEPGPQPGRQLVLGFRYPLCTGTVALQFNIKFFFQYSQPPPVEASAGMR